MDLVSTNMSSSGPEISVTDHGDQAERQGSVTSVSSNGVAKSPNGGRRTSAALSAIQIMKEIKTPVPLR